MESEASNEDIGEDNFPPIQCYLNSGHFCEPNNDFADQSRILPTTHVKLAGVTTLHLPRRICFYIRVVLCPNASSLCLISLVRTRAFSPAFVSKLETVL